MQPLRFLGQPWLSKLAEKFRQADRHGHRRASRHRRLGMETLERREMLAGDLLVNGDFEANVVTQNNNTWQLYDNISGWTRELGSKVELQRGILGGGAQGSKQHVELDSTGPSSISQVVHNTVDGQAYKLRFSFRGRPNTPAIDNIVHVEVLNVSGGISSLPLTLVDSAGKSVSDNRPQLAGSNTWQTYEGVFVARGAQTKIRFSDAGKNANGLGTFIDKVSLEETDEATLAPNLIVNGSFERNIVTNNSGTWHLYGDVAGDDIPGWEIETGNQIELQRGIVGGPSEGYQHLELDSVSSTSISQTVNTEVGGVYALRFAFKARPGTSLSDNRLGVQLWNVSDTGTETPVAFALFDDATGQAVAVYDSAGMLVDDEGAFDADDNGVPDALEAAGGGGWRYFTGAALIGGTRTKVRFADLGTANSLGTFVDDVSFTMISEPAPEIDDCDCECGEGVHECGTGAVVDDSAIPVFEKAKLNGADIDVFDILLTVNYPDDPQEGDHVHGFFKASNGEWYIIEGVYTELDDGEFTWHASERPVLLAADGQETLNLTREGEIKAKASAIQADFKNFIGTAGHADQSGMTEAQKWEAKAQFAEDVAHKLQDLYGVTEGTDVLTAEEREVLEKVIAITSELGHTLPTLEDVEQQRLVWSIAQMALDVVGIFEPTPFADLTSTGMSAIDRDWLGVGISLVSYIPYIGDIAKAGKLGKWAKTVSEAVEVATDAAKVNFAQVIDPFVTHLKSAFDKVPFKDVPRLFSSPLTKVYDDTLEYFARRQVDPFCFKADTLVSTATGKKPIRDVLPGESVYAYDFAGGQWTLAEVLHRHDNVVSGAMVTIRLSDDVIEATSNHPFWVIEGEGLPKRKKPHELQQGEDEGQSLPGRWVNSQDLQPGDVVVCRERQTRRIEAVEIAQVAEVAVCNLTLKTHHSFAVGEQAVLVHNKAAWCAALENAGGEIGEHWKGVKSALDEKWPHATDPELTRIHGHHIVQNRIPTAYTEVTVELADGSKKTLNQLTETEFDSIFESLSPTERSAWFIGESHKIMDEIDGGPVDIFSVTKYGDDDTAQKAAAAAVPTGNAHNLTMAVNGEGVHTWQTHQAVYTRIKAAADATDLKEILGGISTIFQRHGTLMNPNDLTKVLTAD